MEENVCMSWCSENNVFTGTNVNFLKSSLLFQMSLGSKELYHSNVWAWLIENDHNFVKVFFPDFQQDTFKVLESVENAGIATLLFGCKKSVIPIKKKILLCH